MAAITSAGTGLASAPGTWVGGVVPGETDTVTVAAGHTVTNDIANWIIGNDVAAALTLNGRFKASRVVNSLLTLKGGIANASTGEWDWGIEGDTIPASVIAGVRINYSATMANNKYNLDFGASTRLNLVGFRGAQKTRWTFTTSAITGGVTTSFTVEDASGWQIGDWIGLSADTSGTTANVEHKAITNVVGNTITVGSAWTNSRASGAVCQNLWSNVYIEHYNAANYAALRWNVRTGTPANNLDVADISLHGLSGTNEYAGLDVRGGYFAAAAAQWRGGGPRRVAMSNIRRDGTAHTGYANAGMGASGTCPVHFQSCAAFGRGGAHPNAQAIQATNGGSSATFTDCSSVNFTYGFGSFWSQGGQAATINNLVVRNATEAYRFGPAIALTINGGNIDRVARVANAQSGDVVFNSQTIGDNIGDASLFSQVTTLGAFVATLNNCTLPAGKPVAESTLFSAPTATVSAIRVVNKNGAITSQEEWISTGTIERDNSTINRGRSSILFSPKVANTLHSRAFTLPGATASAVHKVKGFLRFDATFGTATPPSVSLSGLGGTTATFTAPATADQWHPFELSITPTSSGALTLTVSGQSASTTGKFWLDGVPLSIGNSVFVSWAWHYGCTYAPGNPFCAADANIGVSTEATVAAYAGFAYDGTTLTVTTNHSTQELWDWMMWYAASNRLDPILSGTPAAIVLPKNLVLDGCTLTGTGGTLTVEAGKTASMVNGATLANLQIISATSGSTGLITITGLTSSSVAIYDNSGVRQAFQAGVTGTFSLFLTLPNTGTWKYVIHREGYEAQIGTFAADALTTVPAVYTQILNADGSVAYTGSSSTLLSISFTGTTQGNLDIGNGSVTPQQAFDEAEVALSTAAGMDWLAAGKTRISQFNSAGGDYLFLSTGWRLRRASAGDVNATLNAFGVSADGTVVDGVNGSVAFLTSDSPTAIAAAVWAAIEGQAVRRNTNLIPVLL